MQKKESQKERLSKLLADMRPDVTEDDRKEYQEKTGTSNITISRNLNNKVTSVSKAMEMFLFFKGKIDEREKQINAKF